MCGEAKAKHPERSPERSSEASESKGQVEGWIVYIIQCRSGKLYTGLTSDLLRRWREHLRGGSRFTRGDPVLHVLHVELFDARHAAQRRERQIKGWTRRKKLALAAGDLTLLKKL